MRMRYLFGLAVALAMSLMLGAGQLPAQLEKAGGKGQPELGKGKRAQEFIAAFNKGDAKAVAEFWMPDAVYTDQDGNKFKGRAAIEKLYKKIFAVNKGAKLSITVISAKLLGPDVGIEEGITEVTPAEGGPPSVAAFSAVFVKKDGEWHFQSVNETVAQPPSNAKHFEDLDWLIGEWTSESKKGEAGKGESAHATYHWAENKNFIVSEFATALNGIPVVGGTQWLAWDAVDKKVRSWSFYSGGGIGQADWSRDGDTWLIKIKAKTTAGKTMTGTNVLTKTDVDHVTWHMTKLTVDGQSMPDMPLMKMVRVK